MPLFMRLSNGLSSQDAGRKLNILPAIFRPDNVALSILLSLPVLRRD